MGCHWGVLLVVAVAATGLLWAHEQQRWWTVQMGLWWGATVAWALLLVTLLVTFFGRAAG